MRKNIAALLVLFLTTTLVSFAQFRGMEPRNPSVQEGVVKPTNNFLFGIFNPDQFQMNHSVSMSYLTAGGQNIGVTMYTNSMRYQIAAPLSVRADVSMVFSPFSSFGSSFSREISGIYLNRAQIDYQPSESFRMTLQYRAMPTLGTYGNYRNPYMGGMFYDDGY